MPDISPLPRAGAKRQLAAAVLASLSLGACTVGPNYAGAPNAAPDTLRANAFRRMPDAAAGVVAQPVPAQWWTALDDADLNALIKQALANNPNLQAAEARLRQSRASLSNQRAQQLPTVGANASMLRTQRPDLLASTGSGPLQYYLAGFDASWEIDLFGGTRRAVEAASAQAQASAADLADAHVSLAAEVAQAYIDLRARQQRAAIARQSAQYQSQMLTLVQQQRSRGTATDADVERSRTQVGTTQASLPPLLADVSESLDRLAVLCGEEPGALDAMLADARPLPVVPASVAVGDPSGMLQRRPDIRAAERQLAAMTAQIGQKEAAYFPKVTLYGELGFSADTPGHLVRHSSSSWLTVPYLSWNILDFGRTRANVHVAEAQRDEALANYRNTVLEALRDADTSLSRYGRQRENVVSLLDVQASAAHSATLVEQRYRAGAATLIDLLDAERTLLSAQQNTLNAQAQLVQDFVSIQKSLGLGWQAT